MIIIEIGLRLSLEGLTAINTLIALTALYYQRRGL